MKKIFGIIFSLSILLIPTSCDIGSAQSPNAEAEKMFCYALYDENFEAVKEAIDMGANINNLDGLHPVDNVLYYYSLEHMGIDSYGKRQGIEIAEYILQAGADPNYIINGNGVSLLMYTCNALNTTGSGSDPLFELLLKYNADVNLIDKNGYSALDYAVEYLDAPKVEMLLKHGSKITDRTLNILLNSSLMLTNMYDAVTTAKVILREMPADSVSFENKLCLAASVGDSDTVVQMLKQSNGECSNLAKILIIAYCGNESLSEISLLDPLYCYDYLSLAISTGNSEAVNYFQSIADISNIDALIMSISAGQKKLVDYFLKSDEYIRFAHTAIAGSNEYATLEDMLFRASSEGHLSIISMLIDSASKFTADSLYTALSKAITNDNLSIVQFFCGLDYINISYSPEGLESLLKIAVAHGNEEIVTELLQHGAIFREDEDYLTIAAIKGNISLVKMLINSSTYDATNEVQIALTEAIKHGNIEIVQCLLDSGMDINKKMPFQMQTPTGTKDCYTYPIHEAARSWSGRILKLLVENGADLTLRNSDGALPIDLVINQYNENILKENGN